VRGVFSPEVLAAKGPVRIHAPTRADTHPRRTHSSMQSAKNAENTALFAFRQQNAFGNELLSSKLAFIAARYGIILVSCGKRWTC
jgi:hypothetical protein